MKRLVKCAALVLVLALPSWAQVPGSPGEPDVVQAMRRQQLVQRLQSLYAELQMLDENLRTRRGTFAEDAPQVVQLRNVAEAVRKEIGAIEHELTAEEKARRERLAPFMKPVTVSLTQATAEQAAEALTKASGTPVVFDPEMPAEQRFTVQARGVALGAVLEAMAQQANLQIVPEGPGAKLKPLPSLQVDGQRQLFRDSPSAWSREWGPMPSFGPGMMAMNPYGGGMGGVFGGPGGGIGVGGLAGGGPGGGIAGGFPGGGLGPGAGGDLAGPIGDPGGFAQVPPPPGGGVPGGPPPGGFPGGFGGGGFGPGGPGFGRGFGGGPASIAALGERAVVVAEPGMGPNGEPGLWLTLYRVEGTQLRPSGSTFHASRGVGPGGPGGRPQPGPGGFRPGAPSPPRPGAAPGAGRPGSAGPPGVPTQPVPPRAGTASGGKSTAR
jgi:hypothetical protein